MGSENARMVVATFMDFQCPFCRDLVPVLDLLRSEYGSQITVEFHHFPLPGHRHALKAAMVAECADRQGKFEEMYYTLFQQMDSLGTKTWTALASEAGIPDLAVFNACQMLPRSEFPRIDAGRELGLSIGVEGTPRIWVNGSLMSSPTLEAFKKRARALRLSRLQ